MPRKSATDRREHIIEAAVGVLLRKGLAAATTRDVTESIGVGAGLLNHYFRWTELRAIAFERIVRGDLARSLEARGGESAATVMRDLANEAFRPEPDPIARVWIEAIDAAGTDPALADRLRACTCAWQQAIAALLRRGSEEGHWSCPDPAGASWRLLALLDGLIGMRMPQSAPILSHEEAAVHWRVAIAHECGWRPPAIPQAG